MISYLFTLQLLCAQFLGLCSYPETLPLNITGWFAKPKPNPLPVPKQPSGERLKVLHVSDLHIDPRRPFVGFSSSLGLNGSQVLLMGRRQTVPADSVAVKMLITAKARRHRYYQHLGLAISCGACFTLPYTCRTASRSFTATVHTH